MENKNKNTGCSLFEEMLMWTSYRYCIGRHSYVVSMANDIAAHYYNKLNNAQKIHASKDIRETIFDKLRFGGVELKIERFYSSEEFNPIKTVLQFINQENIQSVEEYANYAKITYDAHSNTYSATKHTPSIKTYMSVMEIEDLIPWEDLASLFDLNNHKIAKLIDGSEIEVFPSWTRKTYPIDDESVNTKFMTYRSCEFGWEQVWRPVDKGANGNFNFIVPTENIVELKSLDNID